MNVVGITPQQMPTTTLAFDDFGNIKTQASPYTGITSVTYDPAGNVSFSKDANGAATVSTYDALNRRTSAISSRSGWPTETIAWTYDTKTPGAYGIGRVATMTDPSGSTSYTYERRGLLASTVQKVGTAIYNTTYAYDGNGNQVSKTLPLSCGFDFADRPVSVKSDSIIFEVKILNASRISGDIDGLMQHYRQPERTMAFEDMRRVLAERAVKESLTCLQLGTSYGCDLVALSTGEPEQIRWSVKETSED